MEHVEVEPDEHLDWVKGLTQKFITSHSIPREHTEELLSAAYVGLLEAAERYDSSAGVAFRSFAFSRVRGALLDGVTKVAGLSRAAYKKARALKALVQYDEADEIKRKNERDAAGALADVFDQAAQAALVHRVSLCNEAGDEVLAADSDSPEELVIKQQMNQKLQDSIDSLPELEQQIVREYYFKGRTFDEIGHETEHSKGWVSKCHKKALTQLLRMLDKSMD